jgi:hypothetical protein
VCDSVSYVRKEVLGVVEDDEDTSAAEALCEGGRDGLSAGTAYL